MKKVAIFLFFLTIFQIGCFLAPLAEVAIAPLTTGIIAWKNADAYKYYNQETDVLYRSLKLSLNKLGHPILKDSKLSDGSYYILAGQKGTFKIHIKHVQDNISEVLIRIDFLGNKPYAELIYKTIDENLNVIDFDEKGQPTKFIISPQVDQ